MCFVLEIGCQKINVNRLVPNDLIKHVADACILYAFAISSVPISMGDGAEISVHIAETVYFLTIFLLQSIFDLKNQSTSLTPDLQVFVDMILSAHLFWIDHIHLRYSNAAEFLLRPPPGLWKSRIDFLSLSHAWVLAINIRMNPN